MEGYCPGIEEDGLDIEEHKEQGVEIVAEVELHPGLAHGLHTAFIGGILDGVGVLGPQADQAEEGWGSDSEDTEQNTDDKQQPDVAKICQQVFPLLKDRKSA